MMAKQQTGSTPQTPASTPAGSIATPQVVWVPSSTTPASVPRPIGR
jgi:hypothetical protein